MQSTHLADPSYRDVGGFPENRLKPTWHDQPYLVVAWLLFTVVRLWEAVIAPARIWPDSKNYEAIGSTPLWSRAFWFGGRPPLTPFLWKLTGSAERFVIGQTLISAFAWGFLAWTVGTLLPPGRKRLIGVSVILAFAITKPIALWDGSVLSESLALSGLALLFGASILLVQKLTPLRAAALVLAALWCALARDTQIILPATLAATFLIVALRRRRTPRLRPLLLIAFALLLAAGFCMTTVVESGRDAVNTTDNLYARVFPYPARVAWFASHGMPEARRIDALASSEPTPVGTAATVFPNLTSPTYIRLHTWVHDHGSTTYALWIATHPWLVILEPLRKPQEAFGNASAGINAYEATNTASFGLTPLVWEPGLWLLAVAAGTLAIGYRRDLRSNRALQVIIGLGLIGIPAMLVAWNGDGEETTRHTFEGLAEIHLGVLIALLYVVLAPRPRHLRS
jgi:hypothetical protein